MSSHPPIRFMTTPAFGEVKEHVRAELLAVALTQKLGIPVTIDPARSYEDVVAAVQSGGIDAAWGTAELCDRFADQARAVLRAVRSGTCTYHAALICRAEDPLTLDGLKGTRVAWVTRWSTAGYLLPCRFLEQNGIDPGTVFSSHEEFGSYRRALLALLDGEADVASVYCTHPDERAVRAMLAEHVGRREAELVPFAFTDAHPSDGIIITNRLPEETADLLIDALVSLGGGSGLLPQLGLFDTEGFAVDGHVVPSRKVDAPRPPHTEQLVTLEVAPDLSCRRAWTPSGRINGRRCLDVVGRPLEDVLGPEVSAPVCGLVAEALRNQVGGRIEYHIGAEDDARWFSAEVTLPTREGPDAAASLILRDVTEARALEEALFHLASFPLLSPDPVLEVDRDGVLLYANRAAHLAFPGLVAQGADHPIISAMLAVNRSDHRGSRGVLREVEHSGAVWKITVLSQANADFIRASVVDLSDSKDALTPSRPSARRLTPSQS